MTFFKPYKGHIKGAVPYRGVNWVLGEHLPEAQNVLKYKYYAKGIGWGRFPVLPLSEFPREIQELLLSTLDDGEC